MVTESREHPADSRDGERLRGHEALHHARERMDMAIVASAEDAMGWAGGLHDALDELADVLRRHRDASERPGGSLDEIEKMEPRLSGRVEQSRSEHQPLIDRTEELRDTVAGQIEGGRVEVNHLRGIAGRLEIDFRDHIAKGIELTYEAFDRDMGGEG